MTIYCSEPHLVEQAMLSVESVSDAACCSMFGRIGGIMGRGRARRAERDWLSFGLQRVVFGVRVELVLYAGMYLTRGWQDGIVRRCLRHGAQGQSASDRKSAQHVSLSRGRRLSV